MSVGLEKIYRSIFENAGVAMAVVDEDGIVACANLAFLRLFAQSLQAVEGKQLSEFVSKKEAEIIKRSRQKGPDRAPVQCEFTRVDRTGQSREIVAIASTIPETRKSVVIFLDVTEHRRTEEGLWETEEKFRTIFERAAIGISLVDVKEGKILLSNPAMQKLLGYSSKELTGKQFTEFTHPEDVETQWNLYKQLVAGQRKHFELKKRYIRKDGRVILARLVASLALAASGTPAVVIGMIEEMAQGKSVTE